MQIYLQLVFLLLVMLLLIHLEVSNPWGYPYDFGNFTEVHRSAAVRASG